MKFYSGHHVHHMFSNQEYRIVVSLTYTFRIVVMAFVVEYFILGPIAAAAFTSGLIISQIYYDTMHFWFHFGGDFKIKFFQDMKEKHMRHHYRDKSKDFTVTTPFWDIVFDTV